MFDCSDEKKLQGLEVHVLVQIQAMVDDAEDGHLREGHPAGDPVHADREQGRYRRRDHLHRHPPSPGGPVPGRAAGQRQERDRDLSREW